MKYQVAFLVVTDSLTYLATKMKKKHLGKIGGFKMKELKIIKGNLRQK